MMQTMWLGLVLTRRELSQRYRGTVLGVFWPFLYSAMLLAMFTFVFSMVLKVRWSLNEDVRPNEGALMIFAGLVPYLFIAEVITRSATCITAVPNFVKKVRFPLELLPIVVVSSAAILAAINSLILVIAIGLLWHDIPSTVAMLPLVYIPLVLLALGLAFLFGSLGVFFRDLSQASPLLAQLAMFLAPVCYPVSAVPQGFAAMIELNPLTWFVTAIRDLTLDGRAVLIGDWAVQTIICLVFALVGYAFFQRTRRSFADLL